MLQKTIDFIHHLQNSIKKLQEENQRLREALAMGKKHSGLVISVVLVCACFKGGHFGVLEYRGGCISEVQITNPNILFFFSREASFQQSSQYSRRSYV